MLPIFLGFSLLTCLASALAAEDSAPFVPHYTALPSAVAKEGGHTIYTYGQWDYEVYAVSPTYFPGLEIQKGNDKPFTKVTPKKSWEIKSNFVGLTPTRLPSARSAEIDPSHPLFMVDGNPDTVGFVGKPHGDPAITHAWVKIDFPRITKIKAVSVLPSQRNVGYPAELFIRVCRWDLWDFENEWQIVYHSRDNRSVPIPVPENTAPAVYEPVKETGNREGWITYHFDPVDAREVWITSPANFILAEIQIWDEDGNNIALVSRGAGVSISRESPLFWLSENAHREIWPLTYDLGLKWVRVNYALTPLIWPYVEREKGKYFIDPYTDEVLTQTVKHGVDIHLGLVPLISPPGYYTTEEDLVKGYCNYVRFMVNHFKDRVKYFEIGNEFYNQSAFKPGQHGDYAERARYYARIVIPATKVIREVYPEAKIILVGPCPMAVDFIEETLKLGMAPLVDVISWHPYSFIKDTDDWYEPEELDRPLHPWAGPEVHNYRDAVGHLRSVAAKYGFKGEFVANEVGAYAIHQNRTSALISAKLLARSIMLHTDLEIPAFWNETVSLMRPAWQPFWNATEPTIKPDYSYYVMRTLSTLTDGVRHLDIDYEVTCADDRIEKCSYACPNGDLMLAFWIREKSRKLRTDNYPPKEAEVFISGVEAARVTGYELLNGQSQELDFSTERNGTVVRGLLMRDYPLILRVTGKRPGSRPSQRTGSFGG